MTVTGEYVPRRAALTLLAVGLGSVLAVVDYTVVSVAMPNLLSAFPGSTLPQASWVINAYTVVFAAVLLPAGGFADRFGSKRLFLLGVTMFTVASVGCAFAPGLGALVAARACQAIGGGAMVTTTLSLALAAWPDRRSQVVGLLGAVNAVASAGAPSLGAGLLSLGGWHLIFLINVPIAVGVLVCGALGIPADRVGDGNAAPTGRAAGLPEIPGALAMAVSMGLVALYLVQGRIWGWGSPKSLGLLVAALLLATFGVYRSLRHPRSTLDLRLLRNRTTALGCVAVVLLSIVQFTVVLCVTLFLTDRWSYSPGRVGLALTAGPAVAAVTSLLAGRATARFGARAVAVLGCAVGAVGWGYFALTAGDHAAYLSRLLPALVLGSAGASLATVATTTLAVSAVPRSRFGMAGALTMMSRSLGAAVGIAALASVLAVPSARGFTISWLGIVGCLAAVVLAALLSSGRRRAAAPEAELVA